MNRIRFNFRLINHFLDLIFPKLCFNCEELLSDSEKVLCISCKANLPIIDHRAKSETHLDKFIDINPANVFCFLNFRKENITQKLLHEYKYAGFKQVGQTLGSWFGDYIMDEVEKHDIDLIIPIPLHRKKQRSRGFNQSEIIANQISRSLNIKVKDDLVERIIESKTQTVKSRTDRMFNVQGLFQVKDPGEVKGKHVMLVDDVITTGSTLASCASELQKAGASKISLASLALAT